MAATIETTNGVLAGGILYDNPGCTVTESDGVWTVTHADRLTVMATAGARAGYSLSYTMNVPLTWCESIRDVVSDGHIARHDHTALVIEDGEGEDAAFVASYCPQTVGECGASRVPVRRGSTVIGTITPLR